MLSDVMVCRDEINGDYVDRACKGEGTLEVDIYHWKSKHCVRLRDFTRVVTL